MVNVSAKSPLSATSYSQIMQLIPQVDSELKHSIIAILAADPIAMSSRVHELAQGINSTKQVGLDILPDYDRIFGSLK